MILTTSPRTARRPGFTLIELLTVISIIAVLMAIGIGTYFRVRVQQEERATETTINKLQSELELQWRSVLDNAKDDLQGNPLQSTAIPTPVKTMAGSDTRRIRVMWTKIRLKQEFPQNFWEALKWPLVLRQAGIAIDAKYAKDLDANFPNSTLNPLLPAALDAPAMQARLMQESAVLFYLAVTKGRRGNASFRPNEHLGPHALSRIQLLVDPNSPVSQTNPVKEFEIFVDTWGTPIGFVRWPFGAQNADLNQPPYQARNNQGQQVDPEDPEKTLLNLDWYNNAPLRDAFERLVNSKGWLDASGTLGAITNPPLNLNPVLFSAGRDSNPGVTGTLLPLGNGGDDDNIYSYRIKGVSRTN